MHRQTKPTMHELSGNELAWIEFLRLLSYDQVPTPTLAAIQALWSCHGLVPVSFEQCLL